MRNLLIISGSRADYNKISRIIKFLAKQHKITMLLVDMHNDNDYGYTGKYIFNDLNGFANVFVESIGDKQTSKTMNYFSWFISHLDKYLSTHNFDMTFVHGDRLSALAGSIVSSYHNIPVCQIEAGDVSGNIDESIRHAITKFAHRFLVTDEICKERVLQLGEKEDSIFTIGLTSVFETGMHMEESNLSKILGENYCILIYHPLFSKSSEENLSNFKFILSSLNVFKGKILLIHSNNDPKGDMIKKEYKNICQSKNIIFKENIPPEKYYYILQNSKFIIGNSSSGICEAPYLGVPTIDIGNRQQGRTIGKNIDTVFHVEDQSKELENLIKKVCASIFKKKKTLSVAEFEKRLERTFNDNFFNVNINKKFIMR